MRLGAKLAITLVIGLLIIGGVGIQSYLGIQRMTETNRWVTHSHEVIENLEHVLTLLTDAETGQRGFVLLGEDSYLEPYNTAIGDIPKDIDTVTALTKDNPQQQESLKQLAELSQDKLAVLRETMELRRQSGLDAALQVIRTDRGRRIMDDIRALVNLMERREKDLLAVRSQAAGEVAGRTVQTIGVGVLLSLLVLAVAAVIVTRTARLADQVAPARGAGRPWLKIALQYTFAAATVALATGARWWLVRNVGPMPLYATWYPTVLLVATLAGGGPGILATFLSALVADYWFIEPYGQFSVMATNDAVALGIFTGTCIFLSVLAERMRRAHWAEAVSVTQEQELALLNMGNLMTLDLDHRIDRWSDGNRRLYGFDAQEARGKLTSEFLQTRFEKPLDEIHRELWAKGYWEGEATRRAKDGTQLSLALLWALRRDKRGQPLAILEVSTDITPQKSAEEALRQQSEELAQQNEELTQQTEELSRQSEELTQQSEELSEHNEELQTQSEEIQTLNAELGHREQMLQALLDAARLPLGEEEVMGKICRAAVEMIGQSATGAVVCEAKGDQLQILAHAGFADADLPRQWPAKGSFAEVVIGQGRTAALEDATLRPDLSVLNATGQQRLAAVLSAPLRVKGTCIGVVSFYSRQPQQWTAEQFRLIEWLAAQCSNALEAMRAKEAIRQTQQLLQAIIDNCQSLIYVKDLDGRILIANRPLGEAIGLSVPEILGKTSLEIIPDPQVGAAHMANDRQVIESGQAITLEESTPGHVFLSGKFPLRDAQGQIFATGGVSTDITERKRVEEALRESEDRFRTMADSIPQLAWVAQADGFIYWYNQRWYEYTGTTPQQMEGWGWQSVHDPNALPSVMERWKGSIATGSPFDMEFPLRGADGQFRPFLTRVMPIKDAQGRVIKWFGTNTDITEHKRVEVALRESEERLRFALETIHTGAWDLDLVDHTAFRSLEHDRIFGYAQLLPEWTYEMFLNHVTPEDRATVDGKFQAAMASQGDWNIECRIRRPDGQLRWILAAGRHTHDAAGTRRRMAGVVQDITERKLAEDELRQTAEELRRSNKDLEQFAYVASHDLQEPLRQVRAFVDLLRARHADKFTGDAAEYFQFVYEGATRMSDLVQGLLAFSRVGAKDARPQPVACQQALDAAQANLQTAITEAHARITHDELPTLVAEGTQLTQLFQNLIGNAIKFRRDGARPEVHVGCRRDGRDWLFSVTDNGIGIAPQYQEKVFLIFQRLHGREKYPGTGIGLAICKKIVEHHGGRIWIESQDSAGCTFHFTLPGGLA
jgi:PAS domain S-box-containing protein